MRPCCVAIGQVLIWVVSPDWFEEHTHATVAGSSIEHVYRGYSLPKRDMILGPKRQFSLLEFELDHSATMAGYQATL